MTLDLDAIETRCDVYSISAELDIRALVVRVRELEADLADEVERHGQTAALLTGHDTTFAKIMDQRDTATARADALAAENERLRASIAAVADIVDAAEAWSGSVKTLHKSTERRLMTAVTAWMRIDDIGAWKARAALAAPPSPGIVGELRAETFDQAWARMVARGYRYGEDALEQVRLGFQLARGEEDKEAVDYGLPSAGAVGEFVESELRAEVERMRPVVEAAVQLMEVDPRTPGYNDKPLYRAVTAYRAAEHDREKGGE